MMRAGTMTISADAWVTGRLMTNRTLAIDGSQRIAMVNLRDRRSVAILTGTAIEHDRAVTVSTLI